MTRRAFCQHGVMAGVAGAAGGALLNGAAQASEWMPPAETPKEGLQRLREGQARFVAGVPKAPNRDLKQLHLVAPKQEPFASILSCADSRVPVEVLYDQGFGDLFVVRVAGNVATAVEIASLEYSVAVLGVEVIKVVGHSNCGAVAAALSGAKVPGQISTLYQHIVTALDRGKMNLDEAIAANVRYQVRILRDASPLLGKAVANGDLIIEGGVFDFESGAVKPV
jgi:carbonic anhydrase